ncbi:hypothetical protein B0T24DRAFT_643433 [Lasiosphaeria ovina]|uniref:Uncharacterized protein n=1 Tax=Lasiosphaeria ovina TaxID=92902 RepID=A0AAE0MYJ6_9PEZI|nr:hypothetical protein B0T24DRAFT_643433 [Lasiosphaeria ovina]
MASQENTAIAATERGFRRFPNEMLRMIFSFAQDSSPADEKTPNKTIQNIRLACRDFCELSSEFLLPVVDINVSSADLEYLEAISRHPTIGRGVKVVRLCVAFSSPILAASIRAFREFCLADATLPARNLSAEYLMKGWGIYKGMFKDQMAVLACGNFVTRFASAMAQMPSALSLDLYTTMCQAMYYHHEVIDFAGLVNNRPGPWGRGAICRRNHPWQHRNMPLQAIYVELPAALHSAGVRLTRLSVDLVFGDWVLGDVLPDQLQRIVASVQSLETLYFTYHSPPIISRHDAEFQLESTRSFMLVTAFLNTKSLKTVIISHENHRFHPLLYRTIGLWPLERVSNEFVTADCWSSVKKLSLYSMRFSIQDLQLMTASMSKPLQLIEIDLNGCRISGTGWADFLDLMRGISRVVIFYRSEVHNEKPPDAFYGGGPTRSPAELFCMGKIENNPLRKYDDEV